MSSSEFDRSHERFRFYLNTEPVVMILSRNLSFLLDENRLVEAVEVDDGLKCGTAKGKAVIGGADFLMREEFSSHEWTAAMRVLLAHEIQHDNSSDRAELVGLRRWYGNYLHDNFGVRFAAGTVLGQRLLNALEDGRINNIICRRFPGYVPMLRFTYFARRENMKASPPEWGCWGELTDFIKNVDSLAVTGLEMPGAEIYAGTRLSRETEKMLPYIEASYLATTARECVNICSDMLTACAPYLAALCGGIEDLDSALEEIRGDLQEYAYSDSDRLEQRGDGTDGGGRFGKGVGDGQKNDSAQADEAPGEKGDTGAQGGGNNTERIGDESGSLASQETKAKNGGGNSGREDRGASSSDGQSDNHGRTGLGVSMANSQDAASEKARHEGPQSISEVIGTGWSGQKSPALTGDEVEDMLTAARDNADNDRQEPPVKPGSATPLSLKDRSRLKKLYKNVEFKESFVLPENRRLPPEYMEEAKRLHQRLDRILRELRVRTANQRKGSLSQKALWKCQVNDKDIFQRKSPPDKCQSAFYLLIDRSGSMGAGYGNGTSRLFTALMTAAVLEEALKGLARAKVVAFDGGGNIAEHVVIKDFDQKESGNRCCDALTQVFAGNGNKDGYSIRVAADDLEKRSEKRKILIVLSDGLPSAYQSENEAVADVRSAVREARRRGVIVIPIMYGVTDTAESYAAYQDMYEKTIISVSGENILSEFEKLIVKLIN